MKKQEEADKAIKAFSQKRKKRFRINVVDKGEYSKYENVEYFNKEEYEDRIPLLVEHLNREGQIIPIVVNNRKGKTAEVILSDWIIFKQMVKLEFQQIKVYVFQLDETEERQLFEELNLIYGRLPFEIEEEIIERRLKEELQEMDVLETYKDKLEVQDTNEIRKDKEITYARYKTKPPIRKMHRQMLNKVKLKTGIISDEKAMTYVLKTSLNQLKEKDQ